MTAPYWVRIRRTGDAFAGFTSPDGKEWTQRYGAAAAGIPKSIYIGYAVTSEVGGKPITATAHAVYFGTTPDLGPADYRVQLPAAVTMYFHAPGLTPGATYYWRVDEIEADAKTIHPGDVWSFTAQALLAYLPEPADGATDASTTPTLLWQPGQTALKHHLFFSDNREAVTQGAPGVDQGTFPETTFVPGPLESVATYYWRVDEIVADDSVRAGQVWSFTTCLPVDDFENLDPPIWEVWLDGWTNGTGSQVGYLVAPFAEQVIVHSGRQSMPMDYNNVKSPWYSQAERAWMTPQNWTVNGVNTLALYLRGAAANTPAPFYVAVEDTADRVGIVSHPDPALVTTMQWTQWKIPLAGFTSAGVNVAAVKKMYLGVGDRSKPAPGGAGRIYLDDIRVTKP